jgi:hypothetical protein
MISPDIKIEIKPAYMMNGINVRAKINGKHYILDTENVKKSIEKQIRERGFTTNRTGRQLYERLTINN